MNDILTSRIDTTSISGDVGSDLITTNGPGGDEFNLNVPQGYVARLWDWGVFGRIQAAGRVALNLSRMPRGPDGVRVWINDDQIMQDGGTLSAITYTNNLSGTSPQVWPVGERLWEMDYRVVMNPRVAGFAQVTQDMAFQLRYTLLKASRDEIAAILFWQGSGVKVE